MQASLGDGSRVSGGGFLSFGVLVGIMQCHVVYMVLVLELPSGGPHRYFGLTFCCWQVPCCRPDITIVLYCGVMSVCGMSCGLCGWIT